MRTTITKAKTSLIAIIILVFSFQTTSFAQSYWQLGGNPDAIPPSLGLLSTSNFFGSTQTADLQFGTGGTTYMFMGGTGYTYPGFIGIGNGFTTPAHLFDVNGGDINVNTTTNGYMLGGQMFLWHNGNANNVFLGINTGSTGNKNTFVGSAAGQYNGTNGLNTYLGWEAGNNAFGASNTYLGGDAGSGSTGQSNTFTGNYASQ
jgi:hypothetical protein